MVVTFPPIAIVGNPRARKCLAFAQHGKAEREKCTPGRLQWAEYYRLRTRRRNRASGRSSDRNSTAGDFLVRQMWFERGFVASSVRRGSTFA